MILLILRCRSNVGVTWKKSGRIDSQETGTFAWESSRTSFPKYEVPSSISASRPGTDIG